MSGVLKLRVFNTSEYSDSPRLHDLKVFIIDKITATLLSTPNCAPNTEGGGTGITSTFHLSVFLPVSANVT